MFAQNEKVSPASYGSSVIDKQDWVKLLRSLSGLFCPWNCI